MWTVSSPRLAVIAASLLAFAFAFAFIGCADDPTGGPASGTVTLTRDKGIDFRTGAFVDKANYTNADLIASENGDAGLKLMTGGSNPAVNRPITWHRNAGLVPRTFPSLDDVLTDRPTLYDNVPNAKKHFGFVLESADGDHIRGWIEDASATSVTIQWDRLPSN